MRRNMGEMPGRASFRPAEAGHLPSIPHLLADDPLGKYREDAGEGGADFFIFAAFSPKSGRPALENAAYEG